MAPFFFNSDDASCRMPTEKNMRKISCCREYFAQCTVLLGMALMLTLPDSTHAQTERHWSASAHALAHESSRIFTDPLSASTEQRSAVTDFGWSAGYCLQLERELSSEVRARCGAEYTSTHSSWNNTSGMPLEDGYQAWMVEAGASFSLPLRADRFRIDIGGGVGMTFAKRALSVGGVSAIHDHASPAFGIHVFIDVEYRPVSSLGVRMGVLARDPQVTVWNRFPVGELVWDGITVPLPVEPFASRINLHGTCFDFGLVWYPL
jgi:hypothetical protein